MHTSGLFKSNSWEMFWNTFSQVCSAAGTLFNTVYMPSRVRETLWRCALLLVMLRCVASLFNLLSVTESLMFGTNHDVCPTESQIKVADERWWGQWCWAWWRSIFHKENLFYLKANVQSWGMNGFFFLLSSHFFGFPVSLIALTSVWRPTGLICSHRCLDCVSLRFGFSHVLNTNTHA